MSSNIFRCSGKTAGGSRCKREAVRAEKFGIYMCPAHQGQPVTDWGEVSGNTTAQSQALDHERRSSCRDAVTYLREGDREGAYLRLMAGFHRQVRLAGLEGELRHG